MKTVDGSMDFLQKIVEKKREQVRAAAAGYPLSMLRAAAEARRDFRGFGASLAAPVKVGRAHIIAEIKRASPSKGVIRADVNAAETAGCYARGGAAAISVLTETEWFRGSVDDLIAARDNCLLPVLRKDFTIDEYQIVESAAIGADAILLIVRILDEGMLAGFMDTAHALGLDCLVEVHTPEELEIAQKAGATLIGINNRNLNSFETDISIAAGMAAMLSRNQQAVAASGIGSRADVEAGLEAGINSFLVGESIMVSQNPEAFLRGLAGLDSPEK